MHNILSQRQETARDLYLSSELTQAQIAQVLEVTQKTVSIWINEHKWFELKENYKKTPLYLITQMNRELTDINNLIESREPGKQIPTTQEADLRRKIIAAIKELDQRQSVGATIEVMMDMINFVQAHDHEDAKLVLNYATKYIEAQDKYEKHKFKPVPIEKDTDQKPEDTPNDNPAELKKDEN